MSRIRNIAPNRSRYFLRVHFHFQVWCPSRLTSSSQSIQSSVQHYMYMLKNRTKSCLIVVFKFLWQQDYHHHIHKINSITFIRACICKRLRTSNWFRQAGNLFLGSLKALQIQAQLEPQPWTNEQYRHQSKMSSNWMFLQFIKLWLTPVSKIPLQVNFLDDNIFIWCLYS